MEGGGGKKNTKNREDIKRRWFRKLRHDFLDERKLFLAAECRAAPHCFCQRFLFTFSRSALKGILPQSPIVFDLDWSLLMCSRVYDSTSQWNRINLRSLNGNLLRLKKGRGIKAAKQATRQENHYSMTVKFCITITIYEYNNISWIQLFPDSVIMILGKGDRKD